MLLFGAVAEATFWLEFATRFNFIAVDYLLYTHEVIGNIRESYPVPWILTGLALAALAIAFFMRGWLRHADARPPSRRRRLAYVAAAVALPALAHDASRPSTRWAGSATPTPTSSPATGCSRSPRRCAATSSTTIGSTPPCRRRTPTGSWRDWASSASRWTPADAPEPRSNPGHEATEPHAPGMPAQPRHVVLIMVESLSAEFVGAYGSTKGLTPNLDRFARDGLKFTNAYATGTRTVRGLEAASVGHAARSRAVDRAPARQRASGDRGRAAQHQGYATSFVYGGYGYFDNMNAYFAGNDYHVVDRVDFPKSSVVFENVWGVADESLFANVLDVIDANARARQAVVHARHDDVEPPAVHLSRRPDRHPLAWRTRRRRQVHRLGHRQVHRRRAGESPGSTRRCS